MFSSIKSGLSRLKSKIKSGLFKLKSGLPKLKSGLFKIKSGLPTLKSGLFKLESDLFKLESGLPALKSGLPKIKSGLPTLKSGLPTFKVCLSLCRISNLPTVWTNVLAAMVLSGDISSLGEAASYASYFCLLAVSLSCFYCGGMCLNDICDREIDLKQKKFRPIPAGKIELKQAMALTIALFAVGLGVLAFFFHPNACWYGLLLLATIVLYDIKHKAYAGSVFLMAGCRWLVFIVTAMAFAGEVCWSVQIAALVQGLYVVSLSFVARMENARGPFSFPVIPLMIAAISLIDGIIMACFVSFWWFIAGISCMFLTLVGQKYVRGD